MRIPHLLLISIIVSCKTRSDHPKQEMLTIYNNELTTIPDSIFKKKGLTSLNIGCLGFTLHPPLSEAGGDGINYVELPLKELPERIGLLTNLESLKLNGTRITALPASVSKLTKLDTLDLSLNKDLDIAKEIDKIKVLPVLRYLNIFHTKLEPGKIDSVKNLLSKKTKVIFTEREFLESIPSL